MKPYTLTSTNRNSWNDWYLQGPEGAWALANDWREQLDVSAPSESSALPSLGSRYE